MSNIPKMGQLPTPVGVDLSSLETCEPPVAVSPGFGDEASRGFGACYPPTFYAAGRGGSDQGSEVPCLKSLLGGSSPLSKWVITPVIDSGLTLLIPFITGVITHLLTGILVFLLVKLSRHDRIRSWTRNGEGWQLLVIPSQYQTKSRRAMRSAKPLSNSAGRLAWPRINRAVWRDFMRLPRQLEKNEQTAAMDPDGLGS